MNSLNGRPAKRFVWTLSETQFQVAVEIDDKYEVFAESSSWSTLENAFSDMMAILGDGRRRQYRIVEELKKEEKHGSAPIS
jgi:hypothetical protein